MQVLIEEPKEKRQFTRFAFRQPVLINRGEWEAEEGSLSGDVSEGGMRLNVNEFTPVGTVLTLEVFLPKEAQIPQLTGRVVWTAMLPYSDRYQIGIQFDPQQNPSKFEILKTVNPHLQPI